MFKEVMRNFFDFTIKRHFDNMCLLYDVIKRRTNKLTDVFSQKEEIIENIILFRDETGRIEELQKKAESVTLWVGVVFLIVFLGLPWLFTKFNLPNPFSLVYLVLLVFSMGTYLIFNRINNYVKAVHKEVKRMDYEPPEIK